MSNSKAGTDDFTDNSQSLLDIIPINIQMSDHAHSAGVHRTTEHLALGQPFSELRGAKPGSTDVVQNDVGLNLVRLNTDSRYLR